MATLEGQLKPLPGQSVGEEYHIKIDNHTYLQFHFYHNFFTMLVSVVGEMCSGFGEYV